MTLNDRMANLCSEGWKVTPICQKLKRISKPRGKARRGSKTWLKGASEEKYTRKLKLHMKQPLKFLTLTLRSPVPIPKKGPRRLHDAITSDICTKCSQSKIEGTGRPSCSCCRCAGARLLEKVATGDDSRIDDHQQQPSRAEKCQPTNRNLSYRKRGALFNNTE